MDIKNTIDRLKAISEYVDSKDDSDAIDYAIKVLNHLEHLHDEKTDFQGWKEKQLTLGDLKKFVEKSKGFDENAKIVIYEDDGMGYGANNGTCADIYLSEDLNGNDEVKVWF